MRTFLLTWVLCLGSYAAHAYGQLGIRITAPGLFFPKVYGVQGKDFSGTMGLGWGAGLLYDHTLGTHYCINTHLGYVSHSSSLQKTALGISSTQSSTVHCLELNPMAKLYTVEVILDGRLYCQLGPLVGVSFGERINSTTTDSHLYKHNKLYAAINLGAGGEYNIGTFSAVFAELNYTHGISNIAECIGEGLDAGFSQDMLSIGIGVKL